MKSLFNYINEASLLDIDGTIELGNKLENVDLTSMFNSKSKIEFETKFDVFRYMLESDNKNKEVYDVKPRKTYIVFVKNISMKSNDPLLCRVSVYIGTTNDLYRMTWIKDDRKDRMVITKMESVDLNRFTKKYNNLEISMYICPKKIKDEANKLITYNLE